MLELLTTENVMNFTPQKTTFENDMTIKTYVVVQNII